MTRAVNTSCRKFPSMILKFEFLFIQDGEQSRQVGSCWKRRQGTQKYYGKQEKQVKTKRSGPAKVRYKRLVDYFFFMNVLHASLNVVLLNHESCLWS